MKLIKILRFIRIIRFHFLKPVTVVGTLFIHALVDDEELTALDWNQCVATEGTAKDHMAIGFFCIGRECIATDLAKELPFITIVFVKVMHGRTTAWTAYIFGNVAGRMMLNGRQLFAVLPLVVP